jgi:hypothetical protein
VEGSCEHGNEPSGSSKNYGDGYYREKSLLYSNKFGLSVCNMCDLFVYPLILIKGVTIMAGVILGR